MSTSAWADGPWLGVQRLAEAPGAALVLEEALRLGVRWLDVADVYGASPGDAERLLRPFAGRVAVCTKGGLVRDGRAWRPDGRARHLLDAAERSRERLGVEALDLYLWHAPDPRTDVRVSARALRRILESGVARRVGVSNLTAAQLLAASEEVPVAALEVEVSRVAHDAVRSGAIELARALGIVVLAHRPLGGREKAKRALAAPAVLEVAARRGVEPATVALAWLRDLALHPIPGPTRVEQLAALLATLALDDEDRARLDPDTEAGRQLRVARALRRPPAGAQGEVVLVAGSPGAGKSRRVAGWPDHLRLNRDQRGGTLDDLLRPLDAALASGVRRVVLDNTYPTRARRNAVLETAWRHGVPVRCEWLAIADSDAERNVVLRLLDALGRLPEPEELEALNRKDPGILPPRALHRFREQVELPTEDEGFLRVDRIPFVRDPGHGEPGLLVDPVALERHPEVLRAAAERGERILVAGWAPGADRAIWVAAVEALAAARGLRVAADVCPHPAGPPVCWCRKPLPGLPVLLARRAGVDLDRTRVLLCGPADRTLAARLALEALEP